MGKIAEKMINATFSRDDAVALVKRFAGFCFFSEETEKEIIQSFKKEEIITMKRIIIQLISVGKKNNDEFDLGALSEATMCSIKEIKNLIETK